MSRRTSPDVTERRVCPDCGGPKTNPAAKRCRDCYYKSRPRAICVQPDCCEPVTGHGLCEMHRQRMKAGRDLSLPKFAKNRPADPYVGNWFDNGHGYIVRNEFGAFTSGRREVRVVFQHRWLMEQKLGRSLLPTESVHHINGVRYDNRLDNLELWSKSQPAGQRVADKVEWATELLKLYAPDRLS